ncbi:MAG: ribosome maturation factor RimM [Bacteriovoracales bacterium]|nr:ribosome maturation factor RimM [Bacteriovoracales bacterium]
MQGERPIHLGHCGRPHGIKGGLTLRLFNEDTSSLRPGLSVSLRPPSSSPSSPTPPRHFEIRDIRFGSRVICYFKGVENRDQAAKLVSSSLYMSRGDLAPLQKGEIYVADMAGLGVLDSSGQRVGEVVSTYENGAQTVLEVDWEGQRLDIPFAPPFVLGHDVASGVIRLTRPKFLE